VKHLRARRGLCLERNAFVHAGSLVFYTLFSLAPIAIIAVTIAVIFKILPDVHVEWLGRVGGSRHLRRDVHSAAGSLVLILLWVYYSSLILFFGAAFTKARTRRKPATCSSAAPRLIVPQRAAIAAQALPDRGVGGCDDHDASLDGFR
jgi:uncharacterized BrkB/YihY/UPF0761 family membrane protein